MVLRIRGVVAAAVVTVVGLSVSQIRNHYQDQMEAGFKLVSAATEISKARLVNTFHGIDGVLLDLEHMVRDDQWPDGDRATLLRARAAAFPEMRNLFVVDPSGIIVVGSSPAANGIDVSDREYFQRARDNRGRELVISEPLESRLKLGYSVLMARGIYKGERFLGVAVAAIKPDFFTKEVRSAFIDDGSRAVIARRDGTILTRLPEPEKWLGKSMWGGELFNHFQAASSGRYLGRSFFDGGERLVAYSEVPGYDAVVSFTLSKDDVLRQWRRSALVMLAADLALVVVAAVLTRILARKRIAEQAALERVSLAQTQARKQAERLDLALKGANDGWWDWDLVADQVYYSPRWWRMLGYEPDELPADPGLWRQLLHPGDAERVGTHLAQALEGGDGGYEMEFRLRGKDGHYVPVLSRCHIVRDADGRAVRVSGTNTDVSERKRAEQALRASEEVFHSLFALSPLGMARNRMDGSFLDANRAFLDVLGYSWEELQALSYWDLTPESFADQEALQLAALGTTGRYGPYDKEYIRRDGRRVPVRLRGVRIHDINGEPSIWSIVEDVSERRASEQAMADAARELARSNAELEQFAYVASHDLREPLRMVTSYVTLLERRFSDKLGDEGREFINYARDGATRMDRLILDLLEYSRVHRADAEMVPTSSADAVALALDNLREAVLSNQAIVTVEPGMPSVRATPVQLQRLFQNLVGNALKYRSPDRAPEISISAQGRGAEVEFAVSDNGIGIDAQYHERIFGIFQRLHTRDKYEGTGIGLAVCRSIVERHGGRIWVESMAGEGSTFKFTLKAAG